MKKLSTRCVALLTAGVLLLSGCFTYVPMDVGAVPVGQDVRIYLTTTGMIELNEVTRAGSFSERGPVLQGTLTSRDPDRLLVRIPVPGFQAVPGQAAIEREVPVFRGQIVELESRQFHPVRSSLVAAATVGALAVIFFSVFNLRTSPGDPGDPDNLRPVDNEQEVRIPLFHRSR